MVSLIQLESIKSTKKSTNLNLNKANCSQGLLSILKKTYRCYWSTLKFIENSLLKQKLAVTIS